MDIINDYYNEVICNINEGIIVIDKKGIIQIINNAAERMLKVHADNSIGEYILNIFSSSKLISVIENGEAEVNKREGKFIVTRKLIARSGEVIGAFEIFHEAIKNNLLIDVNGAQYI